MSKRMPVLFIGHGSPMNAIEDNEFTKMWKKVSLTIERPKAIVVISAHWYTDGTGVLNVKNPKTIYDMYGFPKELYKVVYNAPGDTELAKKCSEIIESSKLDESWGFDHGAWSVLHQMYPEADIPVIQISIDANATAQNHYDYGKKLASLREEGILIIGSGNIVHNLGILDWSKTGGFDWASKFDEDVKNAIIQLNHKKLINYETIDNHALAFKYLDHYLPLMYILGASSKQDKIEIFNEACIHGSLSMTSYLFK